MIAVIKNIEWDFTDSFASDEEKESLPDNLRMNLPSGFGRTGDQTGEVLDLLSNTYGFLVQSASIEIEETVEETINRQQGVAAEIFRLASANGIAVCLWTNEDIIESLERQTDKPYTKDELNSIANSVYASDGDVLEESMVSGGWAVLDELTALALKETEDNA